MLSCLLKKVLNNIFLVDLTADEGIVTQEELYNRYRRSKFGEDALLMRRYLNLMIPLRVAPIIPDFSDYFKSEEAIKDCIDLEKGTPNQMPEPESFSKSESFTEDDNGDQSTEQKISDMSVSEDEKDYSYTQAVITANAFFSVSDSMSSKSHYIEPTTSKAVTSGDLEPGPKEVKQKRISKLPPRLMEQRFNHSSYKY